MWCLRDFWFCICATGVLWFLGLVLRLYICFEFVCFALALCLGLVRQLHLVRLFYCGGLICCKTIWSCLLGLDWLLFSFVIDYGFVWLWLEVVVLKLYGCWLLLSCCFKLVLCGLLYWLFVYYCFLWFVIYDWLVIVNSVVICYVLYVWLGLVLFWLVYLLVVLLFFLIFVILLFCGMLGGWY